MDGLHASVSTQAGPCHDRDHSLQPIVIVSVFETPQDSDGEEREQRTRIRKGGEVGGVAGVGAGAESEDESYDFD